MTADTAVRIVRWWTRAYTAFLPADARLARRAEVESDLWESLADPDATPDILPRLLLGLGDDLAWSVEHMDTTGRASAWWSVGTLLTITVSWLWLAYSPASVMMRESVWAFPVVSTFHLLGIVCLFGVRGALDLRLIGRGFTDVRVSTLMRRVTPWTVVFAVVTAVTGVAMYVAEPERFAANTVFQVKVAALALMLVNAWFVQAIALRGVDDWDLESPPPVLARTSGYLSLVLWAIAITAGRLTPFQLLN
jgi:hypothetical protein